MKKACSNQGVAADQELVKATTFLMRFVLVANVVSSRVRQEDDAKYVGIDAFRAVTIVLGEERVELVDVDREVVHVVAIERYDMVFCLSLSYRNWRDYSIHDNTVVQARPTGYGG